VMSDVNGDGMADLMIHISMRDLVSAGAVDSSSLSLCVTGETDEGVPLEGEDSIRIVPSKK
jgi:hypothetical protein